MNDHQVINFKARVNGRRDPFTSQLNEQGVS